MILYAIGVTYIVIHIYSRNYPEKDYLELTILLDDNCSIRVYHYLIALWIPSHIEISLYYHA